MVNRKTPVVLAVLWAVAAAAVCAHAAPDAPKPAAAAPAAAPEPKKEEKKPESRQKQEEQYYRLITLPTPADVVLEVGGLAWLDPGRTKLLIATRRGEMFTAENAYADPPKLGPAPDGVAYKPFTFGLHEPLGIAVRGDDVYVAQRAEVTRLRDTKHTGRADLVETVCDDWQISGSYHEYAFGPVFDGKGRMWVTLNRPFGGEVEGRANWRGWAVTIDLATGKMTPQCCGLRSPAGLGVDADGEPFYTDNQGDWVAVCKLSHLKPGAFYGNETGVASLKLPQSPIKPFDLPKKDVTLADAVKQYPLTLPAVWFPYPRMGKSHGEPTCDNSGGKFGPFAGQMFVGDQANSIVVRCFLEKVGGEYQGACFPFREGLQCGALRLLFGNDGSLFVGQTSRGWGSSGGKPYGLQRLAWTGKTPFEIHEMRARPDGFELTFTQEVDPAAAGDVASYKGQSWTYYWHSGYGCPPIDPKPLTVKSATVAADRRSVRLIVDGLRETCVHELKPEGVKSAAGEGLLHPEAYYTLNKIPKAD